MESRPPPSRPRRGTGQATATWPERETQHFCIPKGPLVRQSLDAPKGKKLILAVVCGFPPARARKTSRRNRRRLQRPPNRLNPQRLRRHPSPLIVNFSLSDASLSALRQRFVTAAEQAAQQGFFSLGVGQQIAADSTAITKALVATTASNEPGNYVMRVHYRSRTPGYIHQDLEAVASVSIVDDPASWLSLFRMQT
jgi:hypothetical protein